MDFGPGIISTTNITSGAVTFEAWATFNTVNGAWARLFDFGNISGSSGGNYIFLAANNANNGGNARLAVSDTMPNSDETGLNINNLLGQTGIQIVAVFNPVARPPISGPLHQRRPRRVGFHRRQIHRFDQRRLQFPGPFALVVRRLAEWLD